MSQFTSVSEFRTVCYVNLAGRVYTSADTYNSNAPVHPWITIRTFTLMTGIRVLWPRTFWQANIRRFYILRHCTLLEEQPFDSLDAAIATAVMIATTEGQ